MFEMAESKIINLEQNFKLQGVNFTNILRAAFFM